MAAAVLVAQAFFTLHIPAQTNGPSQAHDRYLFIVDTSAAMRRNAPALEKAVGNLLLTSMQGHLDRGDSIGVWTYNDQLHAGRLPLQRWSPENDQLVATNVLAFLKKQRFEKKPRFGAVLPTLQRVVRDSERITVLLVTSGEEKIIGTPFDNQINQFLQKNFKAQQKARAPFVIVMRARRGGFTGATFNLGQWPIDFSPFPPEPKPIEEAKPKPPPPKPTPTNPPPTAPPLIIIGKKAEAETTNAIPATETSATAINPTSPANVAAPPATPAATASSAVTTTGAAATSPQPKSEASETLPKAAPSQEAESKPPPTDSPKPASTSAVGFPQPIATSPSDTATVALPPLASSSGQMSPTTAETNAVSSPAVESPTDTPPAQVATATAPERPFRLAILLTVITVLVAVVAIGYFLIQRRARTHASLITRSMDQDRK